MIFKKTIIYVSNQFALHKMGIFSPRVLVAVMADKRFLTKVKQTQRKKCAYKSR